jgi:hypothetical protein
MPTGWFDLRIGGACDESQWEAVGGGFVFAPDFRELVYKDLKDASAILLQLHKRMKESDRWKAPGVLLPPSFRHDVLNGTFKDLPAMARRLAEVQRYFLELLGGFRWLMSIDDDLEANLSFVAADLGLDISSRMIDWDLPQSYGRGVLIDLLRDWREINIPHYVENGVPVHYMWNPTLQADPRFRSLSPTALDIHCPDASMAWAFDSTASPITTHFADQFLQLRYPVEIPVEKTKAQNKMDSYVVDFEGWKARPTTNSQRQRYLKDMWYVEVAGQPRSKRIFFRNRPRRNYYDNYNYLNAPAEESLTVIREIWKFSCCPPPFYRYTPPLANERVTVGSNTIPPDAPASSLQPPPPPPPVFSGDPYADMSDDDEWDDRPISTNQYPPYTSSTTLSTPVSRITPHTSTSSQEPHSKALFGTNKDGMEDITATLTTSSTGPHSLSTPNLRSNEASIRRPSSRQPYNGKSQSSMSTPRHGSYRGSSFSGERAGHSGWKDRDAMCYRSFQSPATRTHNRLAGRPQSFSRDRTPHQRYDPWPPPSPVDPTRADPWDQIDQASAGGRLTDRRHVETDRQLNDAKHCGTFQTRTTQSDNRWDGWVQTYSRSRMLHQRNDPWGPSPIDPAQPDSWDQIGEAGAGAQLTDLMPRRWERYNGHKNDIPSQGDGQDQAQFESNGWAVTSKLANNQNGQLEMPSPSSKCHQPKI